MYSRMSFGLQKLVQIIGVSIAAGSWAALGYFLSAANKIGFNWANFWWFFLFGGVFGIGLTLLGAIGVFIGVRDQEDGPFWLGLVVLILGLGVVYWCGHDAMYYDSTTD